MARRLYCYVEKSPENYITDQEWEEIRRLQNWYSYEFIWTAGRPALKMFAVFPNLDHPLAEERNFFDYISHRWSQLKKAGRLENEVIRQLADEKLIITKEGGYYDNCILSGSVRVADNEWNAYLFSELVLKSSRIAQKATFKLHDEGDFIRWRPILIKNGDVVIYVRTNDQYRRAETIVRENRLFPQIISQHYNDHPYYRTKVAGFNKMQKEKRQTVLKQWNWHGYDSYIDQREKSADSYDLAKKVRNIKVILK